VATLVSTAVDTADDLGDDIAYHGPDELLVTSRPLVLKRILANLIDNARRHAHRIEVTLDEVTPDRFSITVEDDGPGIPPAMRAEALLPFRRLHDDRDGGSKGGAGLGLATVSRAVEVLGGAMILADSPLGGLSVSITLPRTEK
jgi:signal transduction histidine kinase